MASVTISASITIEAPAEAVFAVPAHPTKHAAIDGTGWVRDPLDRQLLTASGQIFRMAMYHANHPNGNYEIANRVQVFDRPHAISWEQARRARGSLGSPPLQCGRQWCAVPTGRQMPMPRPG